MLFLNLGVLAVVAAATWWLTGVDKNVSGESRRGHYLGRSGRCGVVLFLVAVFLWFIEGGGGTGFDGIALLLIIPVSIALVLRSSLAECFTHGFLGTLDPALHDGRPFDAGKTQRYLDTIAHLIHTGKRADAIRLCEELKLTGEINRTTLEDTLEFLGVKQARAEVGGLFKAALRLRAAGKTTEAEALLRAQLAEDPRHAPAAMQLIRLYAQDWQQPERAADILRTFERQPQVDAAQVEFARRSLAEWGRPATPPGPELSPAPATVEELLASGGYGSAVELLTEQVKAHPEDFTLRLKLAEVYGRYCGDLQRAEKIVREIEQRGAFSAEQQQRARERLEEWRAARSSLLGR